MNGISTDFRYLWVINLRPIEKTDLDQIQKWRNSGNVMPNCRQYRQLSKEAMSNWHDSLTNDKDYNLTNDLFIIEYKEEITKDIGVGGFVRIDWRNRKGELSFYVGESAYCNESVFNLAIPALLEYGFKTLGMHKIYFPVYSFNPYLLIYNKILKEEYVAKEEYYWKGKFYDRVILVAYE